MFGRRFVAMRRCLFVGASLPRRGGVAVSSGGVAAFWCRVRFAFRWLQPVCAGAVEFAFWSDDVFTMLYMENEYGSSLPMPCVDTHDLRVLELVQLFMARVVAPNGIFAGSAGLDLMRFSLVCRTDHTQLCQLRAVTWRLRAEQTLVAGLERTLDQAAESIIDLEDHREELFHEIECLSESLQNLRRAYGVTPQALTRDAYLVN